VILTDTSQANRVYERPPDLRFVSWDKRTTAIDHRGESWTLTESALTASDGRKLMRLSAHRASPDTRLIK
jgi:hypothetical protein